MLRVQIYNFVKIFAQILRFSDYYAMVLKAYWGLHDRELGLAVKKVGDNECRLSVSIIRMKK